MIHVCGASCWLPRGPTDSTGSGRTSDGMSVGWHGPFAYDGDGRRGPDLVRPRPHLRIIPGRVSGEPHLVGSRITTQVAAALHRNIADTEKIAALYPGFDASIFQEAIEFEFSLAA